MKLEIEYCCEHLTCRIPVCHRGSLRIEKEKFNILKQGCTEPGCFSSPSSACKIGHVQTFKILSMKEIEEEKPEIETVKVNVSDVPSIAEEVVILKREVLVLQAKVADLENQKKTKKDNKK